jgi:TonB family protein
MKVRAVSIGILFLTLALSPIRSRAQEPADVPRKVLVKTPAVYPTLAQSMHIHGSVKVEAVISPNGTVKSVAVKGGHPILTQSAVTAVEHWKFEPTARETREMIEIKFEEQ